MVSRLPIPGSDEGDWGTILNDFLTQSHDTDGSLRDGIVTTANLSASVQAQLNSTGTNGVASVNTRTGAVTITKTDVGLENVDNTSDMAKPVSTATQTALNAKANSTALATVATSGSYADLSNKPTIPVAGIPVGGSTGQSLVKTSATDYAASWQTTSNSKSYATIDLRDNILVSETLYDDGSADVTTIFQRALDAAAAKAAAVGTPILVYVPNGKYLVANLVPASLVGMIGESRNGTILMPSGINCAFRKTVTVGNTSPSNQLVDNVFTNFTIDGTNQTSGAYTTGIKGFFFQHMLRPKFIGVTVKNTFASGFGVDFLQDYIFENCIADNCGRGITATGASRDTSLGGSGFGIGTGAHDIEAGIIANCHAINNANHGVFFEMQTIATTINGPFLSKGHKVVSTTMYNNWHGFRDCGATGLILNGCQMIQNLKAGVTIDGTGLSPTAGTDGIISNCIISENGADTTIINGAGGGIIFGFADYGRYTISGNKIFNNTGMGIRMFKAAASTKIGPNMAIRQNEIYNNTKSGIYLGNSTVSGFTSITDLHIDGNLIYENGTDAAAAQRSGITIDGNTTRLRLTRNTTTAHPVNGIQLTSARTSLDLLVHNNDMRSNTTAAYTNVHTLTGTPIVYNIGDVAYTDEQAQDAAAAMFAAGTMSNVTFTYDDAANKMSVSASGSGGGASPLLAVLQGAGGGFAPGGGGTNYTTVSTSAVDLDATNLATTVTVPASGKLLVRFSATAAPGAATTAGVQVGLTDSTNTILTGGDFRAIDTSTANIAISTSFYVTGLTPAASQSLKLRWKSGNATSSTLYSGTVIVEVWSV